MIFDRFTRGFLLNEAGGEGGDGGSGGSGAGTGSSVLSTSDGGGGDGGTGGTGGVPDGGGDFSFTTFVDETGRFNSPDWYKSVPVEGLDEGDRARLSKYDTLPKALKSLSHQERVLGAKANAVVVPGANADDDTVSAFRKAVGAPDTPEGYEVPKPEKLPQGVEWDDGIVKRFAPILHKFNVPAEAMGELANEFVNLQGEFVQSAHNGHAEATATAVDSEAAELRKAWGHDFPRNAEFARRAAVEMGIDLGEYESKPKVPVSLFMQALSKSGGMMVEGSRISGDGIPPSHDPGTEAKLIRTDPNHPRHKKFLAGDKETMDHVKKLNIAAARAKKRA